MRRMDARRVGAVSNVSMCDSFSHIEFNMLMVCHGKKIVRWTVTSPCMLCGLLLEAFCKIRDAPGYSQKVKKYNSSLHCHHKSRFDQRRYIVGSGGLRGRFFMHPGSLWEPGQLSWTSLEHRFWRSILQGCLGTPQGIPESQDLKF